MFGGTSAQMGHGFPFSQGVNITNLSVRIQSPSQMMIGVYNHLLRKVFGFHYHSEKVIGSLGYIKNTTSLIPFVAKNPYLVATL